MIKKGIYTIVILLGIVFTVGYFRYNPTVNYINQVPTIAQKVVRIDLRAIEYSIVKSFMKHPFSFFEKEENKQGSDVKHTSDVNEAAPPKKASKEKKKAPSLLAQIELPSSLFFYSNDSILKNVWVSSVIPIKDVDKLFEVFHYQKLEKKKYNAAVYFRNKSVVYIVSGEELILMYCPKNSNIQSVLDVVLNVNSYLNENDTLLEHLKHDNSILNFATKNDLTFKVGLEGNVLKVKGRLGHLGTIFSSKDITLHSNDIASISVEFNKDDLIPLVKEKQKEKVKKLTTLSVDSLAAYWNGNLTFHLTGFQEDIDTIVTYDYDEDFNKIEKKQLQKRIVPNLVSSLGGSELCQYLQRKNVVKQVKGESVLTINPLFKTQVECLPNGLKLFAGHAQLANIKVEKTSALEDVKCIAEINFDEIIPQFNAMGLSKFNQLDLMKNVTFSVNESNNFNVRLEFQDTSKGLVMTLLSSF